MADRVQQVGHVVRHMLSTDRIGHQIPADLRRLHRGVGAGLGDQLDVLQRADMADDAQAGMQVASRQRRQHGCIIATQADQQGFGAADLGFHQIGFTRGIAAQADVSVVGCGLSRIRIRVDDHDAMASQGQLRGRIATAVAVAADDHMPGHLLLHPRHPPPLDPALQHQLVSGADEQQPHEQAHRRDERRIDQPRPVGHRHDVAIADGGDADRGEIDHVDEADAPVDLVTQPGAIPPQHGNQQRDRTDDQHQAHQQQAADSAVAARKQARRHRARCRRGRRAISSPHHTRNSAAATAVGSSAITDCP